MQRSTMPLSPLSNPFHLTTTFRPSLIHFSHHLFHSWYLHPSYSTTHTHHLISLYTTCSSITIHAYFHILISNSPISSHHYSTLHSHHHTPPLIPTTTCSSITIHAYFHLLISNSPISSHHSSTLHSHHHTHHIFSLYTTTYPSHYLCSLMHSYYSYVHQVHQVHLTLSILASCPHLPLVFIPIIISSHAFSLYTIPCIPINHIPTKPMFSYLCMATLCPFHDPTRFMPTSSHYLPICKSHAPPCIFFFSF